MFRSLCSSHCVSQIMGSSMGLIFGIVCGRVWGQCHTWKILMNNMALIMIFCTCLEYFWLILDDMHKVCVEMIILPFRSSELVSRQVSEKL